MGCKFVIEENGFRIFKVVPQYSLIPTVEEMKKAYHHYKPPREPHKVDEPCTIIVGFQVANTDFHGFSIERKD